MKLTSTTFKDGGVILAKYSRDGANINPPFLITGAPANTKYFALIMEDPDVPRTAGVTVWDHWIVYNIPVTVTKIPEGWKVLGVKGMNTNGGLDYSGPRPPDREHSYIFTLYALDASMPMVEGIKKENLLKSMNGHILAQAKLVGRFSPHKR